MLSLRAKYSIKAMLHLARGGDRFTTSSDVAAGAGIPVGFVVTILSDLRRRGLLETTRGCRGGYRLARSAETISFGEVIRLTGGASALAFCPDGSPAGRGENGLGGSEGLVDQVLQAAGERMARILDGTLIMEPAAHLGARSTGRPC